MIASCNDTSPSFVGIYARFSNDELQRDASIDDQIRTCTDAAQEKGWIVDPALVFTDAGVSGALMSTREGLIALKARVEGDKVKSYRGFVFDDSSRLGRNLAEVLTFCKICEFHQIFLYFVNQELDSRDPNFTELMIQYARTDEQFLKKLRKGVIKGQKGRIIEGMIHGGRYYGYKGIAIPDPTKRSTASKIAIKGVKLYIDDAEGEAVRKIFNWAAEGRSLMQIARASIEANLPRPYRKGSAKTRWTPDNVAQIIHNRLYCGYLSYGKTTNVPHPISGKIQNRPVEETKWLVRHFPDLAIVSVEQWEHVQAVIDGHKNFGLAKLGGMSRRGADAPVPLFSGMLICKSCQGSFVVTGKSATGDRILQCKNFRYYKSCDNAVSVLEATLERCIIDHLATQLLQPDLVDTAVEQFHTKLTAQLARIEEQHKNDRKRTAPLLREQKRLETERRNIIDSLRALGPAESLKQEFGDIEARLAIVSQELRSFSAPIVPNISLQQARDFVHSQTNRLSELLLSDRQSTQQALRRFVGPLMVSLGSGGRTPQCRIEGGLRPCQ
jgi:DNA invertase Pin-like site-specific DNA recombinase